MEILLIFNPQVSYPELSTLSPELTQRFPSSTINQLQMNSVGEATRNMDPSIMRVAIVLTREVPPNVYQSILQSLGSVNCDFIVYPEAVSPYTPPKNHMASSKAEIFNKISEFVKNSSKGQNPKSIRMIAIKKSDSSQLDKSGWNSLGFNVVRSKDAEFNKQMNTIFFKYKQNKSIKFNEIRDLAEIPTIPHQKQLVVVSHMDISNLSSSITQLNSRLQKVFKILFNTSSKMMNSNQLFDLNANKISIIQAEIERYLSKMKSEESTQKYNELKSKININSFIPLPNQKIATSIKSDDLHRFFILDNNNPKFKQMYQSAQVDGTVLYNLQNNELSNPKTILLAPYQLKSILLETLNNSNGPSIVLYDSSGGKDMTDNNINDPRIAFVGKTPEEIKGYLKNKIKFNQNKIATGRTVKFIQDAPLISGTSIDKSLLVNKLASSNPPQSYQWTVRRKPIANKFVTCLSHKQEEVMNASESGIAQKSMRKMTGKKKTMVNLVEHEPSIKVIESQHLIDADNTSITKVVNEYYSPNSTQGNRNSVNATITQNLVNNGQAIFNPQPSNEYYIEVTKPQDYLLSLINPPKPSTSSKVIQNEYEQTVISVKNSKIKSQISDPKSKSDSMNSRIYEGRTQEFKVENMAPLVSNISQNNKGSSIGSLSLNENSLLNATSNFGYSPSGISKIQKNMRLDKNLEISIKPTVNKSVKEDKQVIQIMTTKGAPSTISTSTHNLPQYRPQSTYRAEQKVTRSASIDPSFVDHKYERVIEDGITKYVIKKEYKDELIKKILHEREPLNQVYNHNRERVYSTQKPVRFQHEYNEYYPSQRGQEAMWFHAPATQRLKSQPSSYRHKQNHVPSLSPFPTPHTPKKTLTKNILYIVPNSRQTLVDRVKQIVTKNDTILPYNSESELQSFSFETYKTVILFPKDQNRQSILSKIASNCYVVKLNRQSKRFNSKQLFISDIKQLPAACQRLNKSSTGSLISSQSIVVIPSHLNHLTSTINSKYQLYNSTQQLYQILQNLKHQRLVVVIQRGVAGFIDDFEMPSTTSFVIYDQTKRNQNGLVSEIQNLTLSY